MIRAKTVKEQLSFSPGSSCREHTPDDWTFGKEHTRRLTHGFHDYPARMIPQVAGKLLDMFGAGAQVVFDPYCGTGTSLVEGAIRGLKTIGTDLNPLARLIAKAKTSIFDIETTLNEIHKLHEWVCAYNAVNEDLTCAGIGNLHFWFKPHVAGKLNYIRQFTNAVHDNATRLFFHVAFSETVRESSNTRTGEFKLYRYAPESLAAFNPDVFGIMLSKLHRNLRGAREFSAKMQQAGKTPAGAIHAFNTCAGIPNAVCGTGTVGIVVTSPPYGDSSTTVAYGQYSRLSAAWLGLEDAERVDGALMGGKTSKEAHHFHSNPLDEAIARIAEADKERALAVSSFYRDLQRSIANIGPIVRAKGYACYVVGNRTVKGVTLPTNLAVQSFFETAGFAHVATFTRGIPNKRMPLRNSPTNVPGMRAHTMTKEFIVVMRKTQAPR